jgi:hypothetical protein
MEPDAPIYVSPFLLPVYSYCSRSNDLIDETSTLAKPLYTSLLALLGWGLSLAIFVTPQSLGVTIACLVLLLTVVITAVLVEMVPLALGSGSRFLDPSTILEAAEVAKKTFEQRRKPIEFECPEWGDGEGEGEENVVINPFGKVRVGGKGGGKGEGEGRKSAADLASDVESKLSSLRKTKGRRGEDRCHGDAVFSTKDAVAEGLITGHGPLGVLSMRGGVGLGCRPCVVRWLKAEYSMDDGQLLNTEVRLFECLNV